MVVEVEGTVEDSVEVVEEVGVHQEVAVELHEVAEGAREEARRP